MRAGFGAFAEALHSKATILWIILPALSIFEFQKRAGAIERIRDALAALTDDRRIQALLIAWFFGLFMEGAAGFGTPVALAAPLLVGLGYGPVRAVSLALLGHAGGCAVRRGRHTCPRPSRVGGPRRQRYRGKDGGAARHGRMSCCF